MASHSKEMKWTKDGRPFFIVAVSRGQKMTPYRTRWYVPEEGLRRNKKSEIVGIKEKETMKLLTAFEVEYEKECRAGNVLNKAQKAERAAAEKAEAERIAAEENKVKTFKQFAMEEWLPSKNRENISDTTKAYYYYIVIKSFSEIDEIKLPEITADQILDMLHERLNNGAAQSSVHGMYITLKQVFSLAEDKELIVKNPMKAKSLEKEPRRNKDDEHRYKKDKASGEEKALAYTAEEVRLIEKYLGDLPKEQEHWKVFIELAIHTGMRKGEIAALKWGSIDFKKRCVHVVDNLQYDSRSKQTRIGAPKTGSSRRDIPLSDSMVRMLVAYKETVKAAEDEARAQVKDTEAKSEMQTAEIIRIQSLDSELVFHQFANPNEPKVPISLSSVNQFMNKFSKMHPDIKDFHPHKLRHTFATLAINNGEDIAKVSGLLGHANPAITLQVYTHYFKKDLHSVVDSVETAIAANG